MATATATAIATEAEQIHTRTHEHAQWFAWLLKSDEKGVFKLQYKINTDNSN